MGKYKVCVYAISKDEEQFVERWMDAVSEADLVVVLDTGSTDETVGKLRKRGAIVYEDKIEPWRFDVARNKALDYVPIDVDICVSNDLDEVFEKGWRKKLEEAWQPFYTRAKYRFTWSYKADSSPDKQFVMEKIHARNNFRWIHPVHEVLEYIGEEPDQSVAIYDIVLNHYPDLTKPRSQYLALLELSAEENPMDDRTIFWLGREYMYYSQYDACIEILKRHLSLPTATWDEERSASMRFISNSYKAMENKTEAKVWLYRAIAECPYVREPYVYMAKLAYSEEDWELLFFVTEKGLEIKERSGSYLVEPESWGYILEDYAAISCYYLGLYEKSYEHAIKACELLPNDSRLENNKKLIKAKL